ncbi:MAG: glucoamylase family protein, partial [Lacibacter sp.]
EHYSFLGINPNGLSDAYANYQTQTRNHTLINYEYCKANPANHYGYSNINWGLTASDGPSPSYYQAHSPTNDKGVITPTAALSSFPYTPTESMNALKFFYYKLGDKLWGGYGFYDAFKLEDPWFASSTLAIDQGPIVVMIENYRSGLLWNLFTSAPEIKNGMKRLGFTAPYL